MAYTEESAISKIEILEDGQIQVRRSTRVLKDGVVIAETFHREVLPPGSSLEGHDARVQAVGAAVWTPPVVTEFREKAPRKP